MKPATVHSRSADERADVPMKLNDERARNTLPRTKRIWFSRQDAVPTCRAKRHTCRAKRHTDRCRDVRRPRSSRRSSPRWSASSSRRRRPPRSRLEAATRPRRSRRHSLYGRRPAPPATPSARPTRPDPRAPSAARLGASTVGAARASDSRRFQSTACRHPEEFSRRGTRRSSGACRLLWGGSRRRGRCTRAPSGSPHHKRCPCYQEQQRRAAAAARGRPPARAASRPSSQPNT